MIPISEVAPAIVRIAIPQKMCFGMYCFFRPILSPGNKKDVSPPTHWNVKHKINGSVCVVILPLCECKLCIDLSYTVLKSRCVCDCMVVGFTITCAISAYHHFHCEIESRSGVLDTTLCDIAFHWLATGGFLRVLRFCPAIKLIAMK